MRREDQDKINKFSRLHQREMALEEELKVKAVRSEAKIPPYCYADPDTEGQGRSRGNLDRA